MRHFSCRVCSILVRHWSFSAFILGLKNYLVVDRVLEVVDEYQVMIHKLEHDILLHPVMDSVRICAL